MSAAKRARSEGTRNIRRVSEQSVLPSDHGRYIDPLSGRPRKLASGAMTAIQREFSQGVPTRELAARYGVSTSLILQVCYFTHKGTPPQRPRPLDQRPVVMPVETYDEGSE